ncbi:MAG TPA: Gfo/Idh/MocA family oxidoreductase [Planctomycetota bacterium]|nr:Gfo/Idh/MocA family oxidoreductase [Planctomycetota bacterium]
MLSFGVIGARRKRQGIGEHVARELHRHGAEVRAIVGTTAETVEAARRSLEEKHGIRARGYTSLRAMLDAEALDGLAICSPIAAHAEALDLAAERRLHVLAEKPLLDPVRGSGAEARAVAQRFAEAGRLIVTITQWPFALEAFRRLYPGANLAATERFAFRLSPTSRGRQMIVDSLNHPLSMVRALVGTGKARLLSVAWEGDDVVRLGADYAHERGRLEMAVELKHVPEQPRPAWFAIDGRRAEREVRLPGYTMELVAQDGRRTPLEDPLALLVADFLARAGRGERPDVEAIASDALAMEQLLFEVTQR